MRFANSLLSAVMVMGGVAGFGLGADAAPTTPDRLKNAVNEPQNWLMAHENYNSWRYSKLTQINKSNVANLHVVYMAAIGGGATSNLAGRPNNNEQAAPLVEDGMMYVVDSANKIMKFDVRSGDRAVPLWRYDPKVENVQNTLGIALWQDTVVMAARDARIMAIGKDTGEVVWEANGKEPSGGVNADDAIKTRTFRGTNTVFRSAGGKDIIVVGAGGSGVGWVGGYDAANGKNVWRTYTIPQPGEANFGTWPDDKWKWGGAMPWGPSAYDVDNNTVFIGTGEPSPVYDPEFRPGANLYSVSTLALDADTGKMKWFFQETPNDQWDYDSTSTRILYDRIGTDGKARAVVSNWARNGFFYTYDRVTGEFLSAIPQSSNINWTKGIDPKTGKPVEFNGTQTLQTYNVAGPRAGRAEKDAPLLCMTWGGSPTGIWPASFDPTSGVSYQTRTGGCTYQTLVTPAATNFQPLARECLGCVIKQVQVNTNANLVAIDTRSGKVVNTFTRDLGIPSDRQAEVGTLVTAGGLVFTGFDDGGFSAYDKDTLAELWRFNTGTGLKAAPITFSVGGKQYIAHVAGGDNPGNGIRSLIMPSATLIVYGL